MEFALKEGVKLQSRGLDYALISDENFEIITPDHADYNAWERVYQIKFEEYRKERKGAKKND